MVSRSENIIKFCTSKAELKDAIENMAYNGYAMYMKDECQLSATAYGRYKFVFEYNDANAEPVKLAFSNLWIKKYSNTMYIDGKAYDVELLCENFGGVLFSMLHY